MQRHDIGGLVHLSFDSLAGYDEIVHSISTRHGGVSTAPFDTLNLSHTVGDNPVRVDANLERWHAALALDTKTVVSAKQAQADTVAVIGSARRGQIIRDVDALITNERAVPLMLRYADCVPVLCFDPVQRAVGVIHAGWRGTVKKIVTRTVQAMEREYGTRPADLLACIGPAVGPCCYNVGEIVLGPARAAFDGAAALTTVRQGKIHFDLWEANAMQLRALGVDRIEIARLCTAENTSDLYSVRAEGQRTGRFGALIALR